MGINLDLVGKALTPIEYRYTWKDVVLYALGVGAKRDELDFLFEQGGPKVLPTFAVIPAFPVLASVAGRLSVDLMSILHGEQRIRLAGPIPPRGTLTTHAEVTGIYDKGKGALVVVEARTLGDDGQEAFRNEFRLFVRGAGGFGGDSGPPAAEATPPERAPDFEVTEATSEEQALLYRLNGDYNPLHASPQMAKLAGFEVPILHGLCTYGYAGRAILKHACAGQPARLRSFAARFSGVVYPGQSLTTKGWREDDGRCLVRVETEPGKVVLSNAVAEVG